MERIALARESSAKERIRKIGTTEEEAATTAGALGTTGYEDLDALPSEEELARQRAERDTTIYSPTALTELGQRRFEAKESRARELETTEIGVKEQEYQANIKKYLAEQAGKRPKLGSSLTNLYTRYA